MGPRAKCTRSGTFRVGKSKIRSKVPARELGTPAPIIDALTILLDFPRWAVASSAMRIASELRLRHHCRQQPDRQRLTQRPLMERNCSVWGAALTGGAGRECRILASFSSLSSAIGYVRCQPTKIASSGRSWRHAIRSTSGLPNQFAKDDAPSRGIVGALAVFWRSNISPTQEGLNRTLSLSL